MKLTNDQIERYKGQINLKKINIQGQIKLKKQKILLSELVVLVHL